MAGSSKKREVPIPDLSWIDELEVERAKPPSNAVTCYAYGDRVGIGRRAAEDRLKQLVKDGKLETGLFREGSAMRRYYWPKEK